VVIRHKRYQRAYEALGTLDLHNTLEAE
jgi:hypothetical protein